MENPLVVGILNIVEDKLREFGIQIPDDDREDSSDPIVGYQYAELHDRIQEYLEDAGVLPEPEHRKIYKPSFDELRASGATLETMCRITFGRPGGGQKFDLVLDRVSPSEAPSWEDFQLSVDDRIRAYDNAVHLFGEDAISKLVIQTAEPIEGVWLTVYKDTLGFPDDFDNLTEICVPADWFLEAVDTDGLSLEAWFGDYIADSTVYLAEKAISDGVILGCTDPNIDLSRLRSQDSHSVAKPSLADQIQSANARAAEIHSSPLTHSKETEI